MQHVEIIQEIEALWQTNEAQPLVLVLRKLHELLGRARQNQTEIPLSLEVDIILASNNAFGYGGEIDEARVLFDLLSRINREEHNLSTPILNRLGCTISGTFLSHLTSDVHNKTQNVQSLLERIDIIEKETGNQLLSMINSMLQLLIGDKLNFWSFELCSFIITFYSLLAQVSLNLLPTELVEAKLKPLFSAETTPEISRWRSEWLEKADYFRFISLFLTNRHAPEDLWQTHAVLLTGIQ